MLDTLKTLFSETPILSNYRLPSEDKKVASGRGLQLYEFDVLLLS
jgi:hypothetical protein